MPWSMLTMVLKLGLAYRSVKHGQETLSEWNSVAECVREHHRTEGVLSGSTCRRVLAQSTKKERTDLRR